MLIRALRSLLILVVFACCVSASPPVKQATTPPIPSPAPTPKAEEPPTATGPIEIKEDEIYVLEQVDPTKPALLIASPEGVVSVVKEAGPIKIRGRFVGNDNISTRTFKGAYVWIVTAKSAGECELLNWEVGTKDETGVYRYQVKSNLGPRPPPPGPTPSDPLAAAVQAAITADPSSTKIADAQSLAAVYRAAAAQIVSGTTIKTNGDLFTVLQSASASRINGRLAPVRKILGTELGKYMSTDAKATMTSDQRSAAITQLNRFADILGGVR